MEKFVDALGTIQIYGQVVRLDLMTVEPGQQVDKPEALNMRRDGQLVMTLDSFVRAYAGMGQVMAQLVKAGVLTMTSPGAPESLPAPDKAKASARK